ncbi:hypothetical protein [Flavobacterium muglaense]|uniref:Uncharacterized protein n=1 Tax=Flavobacterium muglaense TaxID=2764716 RepID=A0A923MYJ7_9FLAO|nr:hypothetical protein [Flavobacterium muglaense]MBC5837478.1 hypothetical protein [Flavobacterium muglaense]MBC5844006.1 hypothetical protein [Flavobacterium muglaense]
MTNFQEIFIGNNRTLRHSGFYETSKYGYQYKYYDNEKFISEVHYEVEISCTKHKDSNGFIYKIDRKQIYINKNEPDLLVEQLLDRCAKVIFPLKLVVTKEGKLSKIENHNEIVERWQQIKKEIASYYYSKVSYQILNIVQRNILNEDMLLQSLKKDWLFHLYFQELYSEYSIGKPHINIWESPIFGNKLIDYEVEHCIEEYYTATNKIIINAKGTSIDQRSLKEILGGFNFPQAKMQGMQYDPVKSQMDVQYKLYQEDRSIFSINAMYNTTIDENSNRIQKITLYRLVNNENYRPKGIYQKQDRKYVGQNFTHQSVKDETPIQSSTARTEQKPSETLYTQERKTPEFFVEEIVGHENNSLLKKLVTLLFKKK